MDTDELDAGDEFDHVWRPAWYTLATAVAFGAVGTALALAGLAIAMGGEVASGLVVAAVFGLFPVCAWRWGTHPLLATSAAGVTVRNPIRVRVVPWEDIERCAPSGLGLLIYRRAGKPVVAWAMHKPDWARWSGWRMRADRVAEVIEERAAAVTPATASPGPHPPVPGTPDPDDTGTGTGRGH